MKHADKMVTLLRHFSSAGLERKACADPKRLGRSIRTLQGYCRRGGVNFPDYTPRSLRPKKAA